MNHQFNLKVLNSGCQLLNITDLSNVHQVLLGLRDSEVWEGVVLNTRVDQMFSHHFPGGLGSEPLTYAYDLWTRCQLPAVQEATSLVQSTE